MGRKPIGKEAMTPAQRQRRRRARIKRQARGTIVPRQSVGADWGRNADALCERIDGVRVTRLPRPWKEDTLSTQVKETAKLILGHEASSDFIDALKIVAEKTAWIRLAEERAMRPAAQKERALEFEKALKTIVQVNEAHKDGSDQTLRYIYAASEDVAAVSRSIDDLAIRHLDPGRPSPVKLAIERTSGAKGGRGPARIAQTMPKNTNSRAKLYCALVVIEMWDLARGEPPAKTNAQAAEAAACFWASGGQELPGAQRKGEVGAGWGHWIGKALQEQRQSEFAADIRRNVGHVLKGAGE